MRDELMHYGVLGMKWGVRRFQNEDGSLTPAGLRKQQKEDRNNQRALNKPKRTAFEKGLKTAAVVAGIGIMTASVGLFLAKNPDKISMGAAKAAVALVGIGNATASSASLAGAIAAGASLIKSGKLKAVDKALKSKSNS